MSFFTPLIIPDCRNPFRINLEKRETSAKIVSSSAGGAIVAIGRDVFLYRRLNGYNEGSRLPIADQKNGLIRFCHNWMQSFGFQRKRSDPSRIVGEFFKGKRAEKCGREWLLAGCGDFSAVAIST
jgi:hypothetical protein